MLIFLGTQPRMTLNPIPAWTVERTQMQIQTQMQILPVAQGQALGMSLTLMTVLTLTRQVTVVLRMTNVWISFGQRQPGVSGASDTRGIQEACRLRCPIAW